MSNMKGVYKIKIEKRFVSIMQTTINGLTGSLSFDYRGARLDVNLTLLELTAQAIWRTVAT